MKLVGLSCPGCLETRVVAPTGGGRVEHERMHERSTTQRARFDVMREIARSPCGQPLDKRVSIYRGRGGPGWADSFGNLGPSAAHVPHVPRSTTVPVRLGRRHEEEAPGTVADGRRHWEGTATFRTTRVDCVNRQTSFAPLSAYLFFVPPGQPWLDVKEHFNACVLHSCWMVGVKVRVEYRPLGVPIGEDLSLLSDKNPVRR